MEQLVANLEHACAVFENPSNHAAHSEASSTLLAFRNSQAPVAVCQHILDHSSSEQAKFQAIVTLRDAAVREWVTTSKHDQGALRGYVLHHILRFTSRDSVFLNCAIQCSRTIPAVKELVLCRPASQQSHLVQKQLIGTWAVLLKRGWVDETAEDRHAIFAELAQTAVAGTDAAARCTAIQVLEAVIVEFSPSTASPLGLPWERHDRCRKGLQQDYLQSFYQHAAVLAADTAQSACQGQDSGVCCACLSLMAAALTWDFRPGHAPAAYLGSRPTSDSLQVQPGPSWRGLLLPPDPSTFSWLHALLSHLQGCPDSALAQQARQLVVLLCSLSGDIFPKVHQAHNQPVSSNPAKDGHLRQMLGLVGVWLGDPQAAVHQAAANDEAPLLDACRALNAAAAVHRLSGFERAAPGDKGQQGSLGYLTTLTQACISAGGVEQGDEGGWAADAVEMLLDTWVELLQDTATTRQGAELGMSGRAAEAMGAVFQALLEAALRDAAAGAFEDEEDDQGSGGAASVREDWMSKVAVVGRGSPLTALPLLSSLLTHTQQRVDQAVSSGKQGEGSVAMEQLCLLLRLTAHVLADPGEGETPMIPLPMAHASQASVAAGQADVVEAASHALLAVASAQIDPSSAPSFSPRVMEATVWAVSRWVDTYLLSDEEALSPALAHSFGAAGNGPPVLAALVQLACSLLGGQVGEVELHRGVCCRLLPVLVRRRLVCQRLMQMQQWHSLAGAFAQQEAAFIGLSAKVQRALCRCLCLAAVGLPDDAQRRHYISHLFHSVTGEVCSLAGRGNQAQQAQQAQQADGGQRVTALLECLRGAARGTTPEAQQALFGVCGQVMEALLVLQRVHRQHEPTVCLLLKLAADIVDAHVSYLSAEGAHVLCHWVLHLLQTYSSYNKGRINVQAAASLRQQAVGESYRDLRALLRLLTHLTQRDLINFGDDGAEAIAASGAGQAVDVAQLVFLGLDILIPLISLELLGYPKLCLLYFQLLAYMMEVYPEKVAALPSQQLHTLLQTLEFGITTTEADAMQSALEALAALAKFDFQSKRKGTSGLSTGAGRDEGLLSRFLEVLVRKLLLDSGAGDLTELAADALLPLILAHPQAYQRIGESLLAEQKDEGLRNMLVLSLTKVMSANGVNQSLDRNNKKVFRDNLGAFVVDARSIVRVR